MLPARTWPIVHLFYKSVQGFSGPRTESRSHGLISPVSPALSVLCGGGGRKGSKGKGKRSQELPRCRGVREIDISLTKGLAIFHRIHILTLSFTPNHSTTNITALNQRSDPPTLLHTFTLLPNNKKPIQSCLLLQQLKLFPMESTS